jgi:outer membrane protein OmpA-like peptidoglycan-associated protein
VEDTTEDTGADTGSDAGSDTAGDGAAGVPCGRVEGGGCAGERSYVSLADACEQEEQEEDTALTSGASIQGGGARWGCELAPAEPLLALAALALALCRRLGALLLAAVALGGTARAGVNAWNTRTWDGGAFPVLTEADIGAPWRPALAWSFSYANQLVVYVDQLEERTLLKDTLTRELGVSFNFGEVLQVGASLPRHLVVVYDGESQPGTPGDLSFWANAPIFSRQRGDVLLRGSWLTRTDLPTGAPEVYLGDPAGGLAGTFALERSRGRLTTLLNVGVRLQAPEVLPGMIWGSRLTWGAGARGELFGPVHGAVELLGSAPLTSIRSPGNFPAEVLTTAGVELTPRLHLNAGAGLGMTRGLGSPSWRGLVMLDARTRSTRDTDGDGRVDTRDRCVFEPEDRDGFEDLDGCPEPDNDGDGLLDAADACPDRAERFNGWADEDGCPDEAGRLTVAVSSEEEGLLQSARLRLTRVVEGEGGGEGIELDRLDPVSALEGEPVEWTLAAGAWALEVSAAGHASQRIQLSLAPDEERRLSLTLSPVTFGEVALTVLSPSEAPLAAEVTLGDGRVEAVGEGGARLRLPQGPQPLWVRAVGFRPEPARVEVVGLETVTLVVTVQPVQSLLDELGGEVGFEKDAATLLPETLEALDAIAALMLQEPAIELLRIEGHADEEGSSRYNYALSQRRARAVKDYLVDAGVAEERLDTVGTGEARPRALESGSRRVELIILVWDEAVMEQAP